MASGDRPPVVVALEVRASAALVALAADVARALTATLDAVVLEDERLFAAAALPFTRELVPGRAATLPFEPESLARELRQEGERLRRAVEAQARAAGVHCSVRVQRGSRSEVVARNAMVLVASARLGEALPPVASRVRSAPARTRTRVVAVVQAGERTGMRGVRAAATIAASTGMRLHCVVAGGDRAAFHATRRAVEAAVSLHGEVSFTHAGEDFARAVVDLHPTLVVVSRDGVSLEEHLEGTVPAPLLVVRETEPPG